MSSQYPTEPKSAVPPPYGESAHYTQPPPFGNPMYVQAQPMMFGDVPLSCTCPNCRQTIVTRIEKKNGLLTWLICGGIAFFGGICGCCLIPFCIDDVKDTNHYCPSCGTLLGGRHLL